MVIVNDVHGRISETRVHSVKEVESIEELQRTLAHCQANGLKVSIAGAKHSLGRQAFFSDGVLLDLRKMSRPLHLCEQTGLLRLEGGCTWPAIRSFLQQRQPSQKQWEIRQKQTGADSMTLAGAISVNAHGNVLHRGPISADVEWLKVILADGREVYSDRCTNPVLFSLVTGGMGLFGVISEVGLQLVPRSHFRRQSELSDATAGVEHLSNGGQFCYGDMQLDIDTAADSFLQKGVLNLWEPIESPRVEVRNPPADWSKLLTLAHCDKARAFREYTSYARSVTGRVETRDDFHWGGYESDYHIRLQRELDLPNSCEVLAEFFVPVRHIETLLASARSHARQLNIDLILATLRAVRQCEVSYLRWAKQDYICLVLAIHTEHHPKSLSTTDKFCAALSETCCAHEGSFYLPYRSYASRASLLRAYPNFMEFLQKKAEYDPEGIFQSDWLSQMRKTASVSLPHRCEQVQKSGQPLTG